jgi:ABC-type lipoprotein release transport system permease subunit
MALLDRRTVLIELNDARTLAGVGGATEVAIGLVRGADPARTDALLTEQLGAGVEILTFREANPLVADMTAVQAIEMSITTLLLAVLAGFGVASTALFSVLERTQEFGVMLAMGMTPRRLARVVIAESVLASTIGFAMGAAITYLPVAYLARVGIGVGEMATVVEGFGMPERLYASISGWYWLFSLSVIVVIGAVAAFYPARRAARLQPVEAIRDLA